MRKKGKALSRHTINTPLKGLSRPPASNPPPCRTDRSSSALSRLSCQYFKSMFHYRKNCFQIFFYRFRTARKIHDQRMISDRGNSSAQHCPRRHFRRSCSHRLQRALRVALFFKILHKNLPFHPPPPHKRTRALLFSFAFYLVLY